MISISFDASSFVSTVFVVINTGHNEIRNQNNYSVGGNHFDLKFSLICNRHVKKRVSAQAIINLRMRESLSQCDHSLLSLPNVAILIWNRDCNLVPVVQRVDIKINWVIHWIVICPMKSAVQRTTGALESNLFWVHKGAGLVQGWDTRLPPVCPGFNSWTGCHIWVDFICSLCFSMRFFFGYSGFSVLLKNKHLIRFDLIWLNLIFRCLPNK